MRTVSSLAIPSTWELDLLSWILLALGSQTCEPGAFSFQKDFDTVEKDS